MPSNINPDLPITGDTPGPTTASVRGNFNFAKIEIETLQNASANAVTVSGTQTITGVKTYSLSSLRLTGGANGNVLTTNGTGILQWETPGAAMVTNASLSGTGATAAPLGLVPASNAQIAAGVDNVQAVTAAGLRYQLGAAASILTTANKTVIPAINELHTAIGGLDLTVSVATGPSLTGNGSTGTPLNVVFASNAEITVGTDNAKAITAAGLRSQLGASAVSLTTTAQTVVPAINELVSKSLIIDGGTW